MLMTLLIVFHRSGEDSAASKIEHNEKAVFTLNTCRRALVSVCVCVRVVCVCVCECVCVCVCVCGVCVCVCECVV